MPGNKVVRYKRRPRAVAFIFALVLIYIICFFVLYTTKAKVQTYEVNVGSLTNNAVFTALAVREESVYNSPYSIITSGKGRELRRAIPFILSMKPAGYQRYFLHITN